MIFVHAEWEGVLKQLASLAHQHQDLKKQHVRMHGIRVHLYSKASRKKGTVKSQSRLPCFSNFLLRVVPVS